MTRNSPLDMKCAYSPNFTTLHSWRVDTWCWCVVSSSVCRWQTPSLSIVYQYLLAYFFSLLIQISSCVPIKSSNSITSHIYNSVCVPNKLNSIVRCTHQQLLAVETTEFQLFHVKLNTANLFIFRSICLFSEVFSLWKHHNWLLCH